jgi:hypothetical protein
VANRILNLVVMFVLGAIFGAVGTVAQQSTVAIFGLVIPWGLIVGLIAIACLFVGLRLVTSGRLATLVAALGVLIPIVIFSFKSAGGSVLIPAGAIGTTWTIAPVVIAAIAVAWPTTIRRRPAGVGTDEIASRVN